MALPDLVLCRRLKLLGSRSRDRAPLPARLDHGGRSHQTPGVIVLCGRAVWPRCVAAKSNLILAGLFEMLRWL
ncbi:hypothetical protein EYF80_027718 [Liparis tanakae]|uniref:Uncharacterized protein n=1 Tax=Liparis tanakae TaxID=230148 RepID=A0A4Z2H805_9TELE|nr:hypothetical protein EYF80_027718 [Liparis tanakae]